MCEGSVGKYVLPVMCVQFYTTIPVSVVINRRVEVRCVFINHEHVAAGDINESECLRIDWASICRSGKV